MSMDQSNVPVEFLWEMLQQAYPELELLTNASNVQVCGSNPPFAMKDFVDFYPTGFSEIPEGVITAYIALANANLMYARWQSRWYTGMCYYIAHYLTVYSQVIAAGAQPGDPAGLLTMERVGDYMAKYEHLQLVDASWGQFNATVFGRMYTAEAKLVGAGGMYVS